MPHTNPWDVTSPPGTEQAKNIDNHIRRLRVDIGDRLADLVVDVMADPLVLKPQYSGNVVDKKMVIPYSSFNSSIIGKEVQYFHGYLNAFSDSYVVLAPIILSPGCIITKVELLADVGDTTGITWWLYSRNFATGGSRAAGQVANTTLATVNTVTLGPAISETGALTITVDDSTLYYIAVDGLGPNGLSFDIYGARVTYTVPDSRNTI